MHEMSVMGPEGHLSLTWDPADVHSVAKSAIEFAMLLERGYTAFRCEGDAPGERVTEFDPAAAEYVVVGPIAGG